jgi:hypothetical protein
MRRKAISTCLVDRVKEFSQTELPDEDDEDTEVGGFHVGTFE